MDFDALVNLKHIVTSNNVTNVDIMLLKSAINNGNIDINLSISGNLDVILNSGVSDSFFTTYLSEFIDCNAYLLNTPIYQIFLKNRSFYPLFLVAVRRKTINDSVYSDIIVSLFKEISFLRDDDLEDIILILKDMVSIRHHVDYSLFSDVSSIVLYICTNIDCLSCDNADTFKLVAKELIMKLLTYGYVHFNDLLAYSSDFMIVRMLVYALFDSNEYAYLLSLINDRMLDKESASSLKIIINEYVSNNEVKNNLIGSILNKLDKIIQKHYKPLM